MPHPLAWLDQMKFLKRMTFWSLILLLAACSTSPALKWVTPDSPSFSRSRGEQLTALNTAKPCCFNFEDISYTKIETLPFDEYFIIDESSPVLAEGASKSYALGLALPGSPGPIRLEFLSTNTTSWITTGGFFSPELIVLDEAFHELVRRDDFLYFADEDTNIQLGGIRGQATLPSKAKYLVFRTNKQRLASRSAYYWNGARTRSVKNYAAAISRPPGAYSDGIVVTPHLPVGRIWISLSWL